MACHFVAFLFRSETHGCALVSLFIEVIVLYSPISALRSAVVVDNDSYRPMSSVP